MTDQNEETATLTWECPQCGMENEKVFDLSARRIWFASEDCAECDGRVSAPITNPTVNSVFKSGPKFS